MSRVISYSALKSMYETSPLWLKRAYSSVPFSIRAGRVFRSTVREIRETDYLPAPQVTSLQEERLHVLLKHAYEHVPHYRAIIDRGGATLSKGSPFDVLGKLPLITKRDFQNLGTDFIAVGGQSEASYTDNTGGSSGTPFSFLKCNSMYPIEQAYIISLWRRIGYRLSARKVTLRGRSFSGMRPDQRWQYNPIYNELVLSSYHLEPETVAESLRRIHRFRPRFIHGYPSAIVTFLRVAQENSLALPDGITGVLCGSEPLYDHQRKYISDLLRCRVFSWYGQSESVLLAGECERSTDYHSFPLYGVLELVDEAGQPILTADKEGEIVGTSLNNFAMPFIRYRTGDRGILADNATCACGRSNPRLKRVTGRKQDFVFTKRLTPVPVTAFVFGQHFAAFQRICGMQLEQNEPGQVVIRIVRRRDYSEHDEDELRTTMERSVDGDLKVNFEYVDSLPVNSAGKTEFVIQQIRCDDKVLHASRTT